MTNIHAFLFGVLFGMVTMAALTAIVIGNDWLKFHCH